MELLSDASIASDRGYGAIIDTDIVFDDVGLPYIPAKRLKGVLRESGEILSNIFKRANIKLEINIDDIFGKQGRNDWQSAANFIVPNLYIEDYEKTREFFGSLFSGRGENTAGFNVFNISKDDVISYFTNVRMQTSIDQELGKTKRHSLRTTRVLDKNMVFGNSFLINEKYIDQLLYICAATKKIGSKRNRGFGEVKIYIKDENGDILRFKPFE